MGEPHQSTEQTATATGQGNMLIQGNHSTINVNQAAPVADRPRALHQLPPPPADFTGRGLELAALQKALQTGGATITGVRGLGGMGKTALALKVAASLQTIYPDAQFFLDLQGVGPNPLTPAEVMAHVIRAYHPQTPLPEAAPALSALYHSVLHGQRALLLLDNAQDAAQVLPLRPPAGCALLITSRQHFHLPGQHALDLDALPEPDAVALLTRIAPRLAAPEAAALADLCGRLPLALTLAAAVLAERPDLPVADYLQRLQAAQPRLNFIEASLALSYDLLTPTLQALWCALAVFPAPFDRAAAQAVWALDPDPAQDALSDLLRYSLVEFDPTPARYRLHDLARLFAAARLTDAAQTEGQLRHAVHYAQVFATANQLFIQGHTAQTQGLALFDLEQTHIRAGQAWASQHITQYPQAAEACNDYAWQGPLFHLRLHPRDRIRWLAAGLEAARHLGRREAEGAHLGHLGIAYKVLGEPRQAIAFYEQHLALAREIGHKQSEGAALGNLGNVYANLGEPRRAIAFYEQALALAREIGHKQSEGVVLGNLGNVYADLGEPRQAITFYEQWLALVREIGHKQSEGAVLGNLGNIYADLGEPRQAITFYEQALAIDREIGDKRGEGYALGNLGIAYYALGNPHRAIELYDQALVVTREIGDKQGEGNTLGNLGNAYYALDEPRRAIEFYEQYLALARETGHKHGEGNALGNMALALDKLGERAQAIDHARAALAIFEAIESPHAGRARKVLNGWGSQADKETDKRMGTDGPQGSEQ